jgi:hypothetical protein
LRRDPQETVGAVKARWQGEVLRDGQTPPPPLRAAPPDFRRKRTAKVLSMRSRPTPTATPTYA